MKIRLKNIAAAIGTTLPRTGDINTTTNGHRVWVGLGTSSTSRRRTFQFVRIFPRRGSNASTLDTVNLGRRIAAAIGTDVTVEAGRMLLTVTAAGHLSRTSPRHITRPLKSIP